METIFICNSNHDIVDKFKYTGMTHIKFVMMKKLKSRLHSGNAGTGQGSSARFLGT
jgi:hypothetical protein